MSRAVDDEDQTPAEPPLDPAAERLRARLTRLLLVSGGFMILGFIAVFAALVYKMGFVRPGVIAGGAALEAGLAPRPGGTPFRIAIPAGTRLLAADLDGTRALLTLGGEGTASAAGAPARTMLLLDLGTGQILARYDLAPD